eukprot:363564-Chlamydomonas_euryale.AAC.8
MLLRELAAAESLGGDVPPNLASHEHFLSATSAGESSDSNYNYFSAMPITQSVAVYTVLALPEKFNFFTFHWATIVLCLFPLPFPMPTGSACPQCCGPGIGGNCQDSSHHARQPSSLLRLGQYIKTKRYSLLSAAQRHGPTAGRMPWLQHSPEYTVHRTQYTSISPYIIGDCGLPRLDCFAAGRSTMTACETQYWMEKMHADQILEILESSTRHAATEQGLTA